MKEAIAQLKEMPPDMQLVVWSFDETWQFATGCQVEDILSWEYSEAMRQGNDFYDDPPPGTPFYDKEKAIVKCAAFNCYPTEITNQNI